MQLISVAAASAAAPALGLGATPSAFPASVQQPSAPSAAGTEVPTTADGGSGSLRAAIQAANSDGGGVITLRPGTTYTLDIEGDDDQAAQGDLDIRSPITIRGRGATIDAGGVDRAFQVFQGASLSLERLLVTGGVADGGGEVGNSGGAVLNAGTLEVTRSTMTGNTAVRAGGAIEAVAGSRTSVVRSALSHNETGPMPGNGGGLHLTGEGEVTVDRSRVIANTAAAEGGGLWNSAAGTMHVTNSEIRANTASGDDATMGGGGLYNDGGSLTVERSVIRGNTADGDSGSGGGILAVSGGGDSRLTVLRSVLQHNDAQRAGGAVEVTEDTVTRIERSALTDNTTGPNPGNGGALHITGAATVDIARSTVDGNTATNDGGGLWNSPAGTLTVTRSQVSGNSAGGEGDNAYQESPLQGGTFDLNGTTVPPGDNDL